MSSFAKSSAANNFRETPSKKLVYDEDSESEEDRPKNMGTSSELKEIVHGTESLSISADDAVDEEPLLKAPAVEIHEAFNESEFVGEDDSLLQEIKTLHGLVVAVSKSNFATRHSALRAVARFYFSIPKLSKLKDAYFESETFKTLMAEDKRVALLIDASFLHDEILNRHVELKKYKKRYVSYAIGSGSPRSNERTYLACEKDVTRFHEYSRERNYFLGSTIENGSSPGVMAVLCKIRYCCLCAFEMGAMPVIYYTGHADHSGNWWFYDGDITRDIVVNEINEARMLVGDTSADIRAYIVTDCCCAGGWCDDIEDERILVIAATNHRRYATDETFSSVFFPTQTESIKGLRKPELQARISDLQSTPDKPKPAIDTSPVSELKTTLEGLIEKASSTLLKAAMVCKPTIGIKDCVREMTEDEVRNKVWFQNSRLEIESDWI